MSPVIEGCYHDYRYTGLGSSRHRLLGAVGDPVPGSEDHVQAIVGVKSLDHLGVADEPGTFAVSVPVSRMAFRSDITGLAPLFSYSVTTGAGGTVDDLEGPSGAFSMGEQAVEGGSERSGFRMQTQLGTDREVHSFAGC